jgi:putative heme iron utilization protein
MKPAQSVTTIPPSPGFALAARLQIRACDRVTLGTRLAGENRAYVSLAAVSTDIDASPLLLLSTLSDHTRNLAADPQLSLLFDGSAGYANPQEGPRATVMGRVKRADAGDLERMRRRYLARHPGATLYAGFADFAFYRVTIERIHWVGGFGRAAWVEKVRLIDPVTASIFAEAEPELLKRLGDLADRIAAAWLRRRSAGWRLAAIDPDGFVLARGKSTHRLAFAHPLADPGEVGAEMVRPL